MSVRTTVKAIQNIMRKDVGVDGDAQRISQLCWLFFLKIIDDQDKELELLRPGYLSPIPSGHQWRAWASDPEGITGEEMIEFVEGQLFPTLKELRPEGPSANRARVVRAVFEDAYNYMKSGFLLRQVINKINEVDFNVLAERQHFGEIYEQILNDLQSAGNAGEYYTPRGVTAFMADRIDPRPGEVLLRLDPACGTGGFLTCALRHMRERYVKTIEDERLAQSGLRAAEKKPLPHMLCVTNMLLHQVEDPSFVRHDNTLSRPYVSYEKADRVDIVLTNPPFGGEEEDGVETNFPRHFHTRETADLFLALIVRLLKPGGRAAIVVPDGTLFGEGVKTRLREHLLQECNLHTVVRLPNSVFKPYASIGTNLLFFEKGGPTVDVWYWEHRVPEGQKAYSMTRPIQLEHFRDCMDWWGGMQREGRTEGPQAWRMTAQEIAARGFNLDIKNPRRASDDHGDPNALKDDLAAVTGETSTLKDRLRKALTGALASIAAEPLIAQFEDLVSEPESLSRLRRFVLNLAVRGRLVPQDPRDEPASQLLKQITQATGRNKMNSGSAPVQANDFPFPVPSGWAWARLGDVCSKTGSGSTPRGGKNVYQEDGIPFLRSQNIHNEGLRLDDVAYIDRATHERMSGTAVRPRDLLLNITGGSIGRCAQVPDVFLDANVSQHVAIVRPALPSLSPYLHVIILSPYFQAFIYGEQTGAGRGGLPKNRMDRIPVALPPLAEQHRIVAAVEEFMTLCDGVEAGLASAGMIRRRLLEALLAEALTLTPRQEEVIS